ncbi:hypothetical protein BNATCHR370 (nucleomorph) [Bigelowiella natans]|uniref:Uncharacterized protein n=1 Tax=Bigelowiella natans TaxID=227086 RepID=Q3LVY2_BIGNA|nr:hypothetical protein BNATCHR370 [Bigelowiella natans]ABA27384.1 hypothetical protein [Bigelowiella natans]
MNKIKTKNNSHKWHSLLSTLKKAINLKYNIDWMKGYKEISIIETFQYGLIKILRTSKKFLNFNKSFLFFFNKKQTNTFLFNIFFFLFISLLNKYITSIEYMFCLQYILLKKNNFLYDTLLVASVMKYRKLLEIFHIFKVYQLSNLTKLNSKRDFINRIFLFLFLLEYKNVLFSTFTTHFVYLKNYYKNILIVTYLKKKSKLIYYKEVLLKSILNNNSINLFLYQKKCDLKYLILWIPDLKMKRIHKIFSYKYKTLFHLYILFLIPYYNRNSNSVHLLRINLNIDTYFGLQNYSVNSLTCSKLFGTFHLLKIARIFKTFYFMKLITIHKQHFRIKNYVINKQKKLFIFRNGY